MSWEPISIAVVCVMVLAALVRSTFGFADALLAMPILSMMVGIETATPLVALAATTCGIVILLADWRQIRFNAVAGMVFGSLCGIPLGVLVLKQLPPAYIKTALALLIIGFAAYGLVQPRLVRLINDRWSIVFGFCAGVLGGAYNTQGPPLVIYGTLREWPPNEFRATMQGCLLPSSIAILVAHYVSDLWTSRVLSYYVWAVVPVLLAIPLGRWISRQLPRRNFSVLVFILLLGVGGLLLVNTITDAARQTNERVSRLHPSPAGNRDG